MKASQIRSEARTHLSGKWGKSAILTLIFVVVTFIISFVLNFIPLLGPIVSTVISAPLSYGLLVSMFKINDDEEIGYFEFFNNGFANFGRIWSIILRIALKLIIPIILIIICAVIFSVGSIQENEILTGIGFILYFAAIIYAVIKQLSYSLSLYILNDNPDMTGKEAIEKSAELMQGKIWSLICLRLSFIGWSILAVIPLGLGFLWLTPYMKVAEINFYRNLINAE